MSSLCFPSTLPRSLTAALLASNSELFWWCSHELNTVWLALLKQVMFSEWVELNCWPSEEFIVLIISFLHLDSQSLLNSLFRLYTKCSFITFPSNKMWCWPFLLASTFGSPYWHKSASLVGNSPNQTWQAGVGCHLCARGGQKAGCCDGMSVGKKLWPFGPLSFCILEVTPGNTLSYAQSFEMSICYSICWMWATI